MRNICILLGISLILAGCQNTSTEKQNNHVAMDKPSLNLQQAKTILELPLSCIQQEYPNKLGQVIGSESDLKTPKALRPIFYGCFDWHSSVHGYWSIIRLLKDFPTLDAEGTIRKTLENHITKDNVATELAFFRDKNNLNFERTYGWAWLFVLQKELISWTTDIQAQEWAENLKPLVDELVKKYEIYLPKLTFPIRTGTHDNTAFGLSLSLDYARIAGDKDFEALITTHAKRLFEKDSNCPLSYEPSGHDFLSPCLEEALLMSKVLNNDAYRLWLDQFLPQIKDMDFHLTPAEVSDRSDGHLVHLDGLNFSRATCLSGIAMKLGNAPHLEEIAVNHLQHSLNNISGDHYMGSHWLGTFALYALNAVHEVD